METQASESLTATVVRTVAEAFPPEVRSAMEAALPDLTVQALRLGLEVMDAEQRRLRYSQAVKQVEFIKMQRIYFAAYNFLQLPLPEPIRRALKGLVRHAAAGDFDPSRKVIFAIATRKNDPEAALCRFFLWIAVRINVLIYTWRKPEVETLGVLEQMEDRAEDMLRELLDVADLAETDFRPLNVLIAAVFHETWQRADRTLLQALTQWGPEFGERMTQASFLEKIRELDARSAATLPPVGGEEPIGSVQLTDRFPQHFKTVEAMEQQRTRLRKKLKTHRKRNDRIIDVIHGERGVE